jgi:hypothetical protein
MKSFHCRVLNDEFNISFVLIIFREKQKAYRSMRSLEKRLRDAVTVNEEAQKTANSYKEQVRNSLNI